LAECASVRDERANGRYALPLGGLKSVNVVFSPQGMVEIMGPSPAAYLGMEDQLGTLEAGKLAVDKR
jgi:hypothetical protein